MNRLTAPALSAVLLLALLAGCPGPEPATNAASPETTLTAGNGICETLPPVDSATLAAGDSAMPGPEPAPEPKPEHPPGPGVLPRMWEFGSDRCQSCKQMKEILDPMVAEFAGVVDIRLVDVYEERQLSTRYRIAVIPTQVFIDAGGDELFRHVGVYPRDSIVAKFRELGFERP